MNTFKNQPDRKRLSPYLSFYYEKLLKRAVKHHVMSETLGQMDKDHNHSA